MMYIKQLILFIQNIVIKCIECVCGGGGGRGEGGGYPHFCENGVFGIGAFSLKFAKNNVGNPSPKSVCVENPDWDVLL